MTKNELRRINKAAREVDESYKWPVNGRFNATERAIRRLRRIGYTSTLNADEYALALDEEIDRIVNGALRRIRKHCSAHKPRRKP